LGGNFGGKSLRGKIWRENFGVKFWGNFCREFFLGGEGI